jgi:type IV pilus assembly protein PilC
LYVVAIEENKDIDWQAIIKWFNRIKIKELAVMSRQFAVLIQAGVPIVQCLDILTDQVENKHLKIVMRQIYQDVEIGTSFSEALEKHGDTFPPLYSRMVNAGEVGGILDVVMNRLADYYERENDLRNKIRSAMTYPVVVLGVAFLIVFFLMTTVVPVFADLFKEMGGELPALTQAVMGVSTALTTYWYLIVIFGSTLVITVTTYFQTPRGQMRLHRFQLRVPVLGKLLIKLEVARFTRTLGSLLQSGVTLMESLRVVERIISNQVIAEKITEARLKVREGIRLSEPLKESGIFPRIMTQMLVVGEETGTMDEMLEKIAHFFDKETENSLQAAMSLVEPLMIIFVAVIVAVIVIAIVIPMFSMVDLVQ